jgi:hypothetical protein
MSLIPSIFKEGKWYGEEFSNTPAKYFQQTFNTIPTCCGSVQIISNVAARSNVAVHFFKANNNNVAQHTVNAWVPAITIQLTHMNWLHHLSFTIFSSLQYTYQPAM